MPEQSQPIDEHEAEILQHVFYGKLDHLPSLASKIVRIFTSSTFTGDDPSTGFSSLSFFALCSDTSMERNSLMKHIYPKLKEFCREKHGLEFQVVDMRWGVRDEATDDHKTTELCMQEIDNCQRVSVGPNFVVRRRLAEFSTLVFLCAHRRFFLGKNTVTGRCQRRSKRRNSAWFCRSRIQKMRRCSINGTNSTRTTFPVSSACNRSVRSSSISRTKRIRD